MDLLPFRCLRPAPRLVGRQVAAPLDVFDRDLAFTQVADNPLSFLAIDWPETLYPLEAQVDLPEAYAEARDLLDWRQKRGVLVEDGEPCLYVYAMEQAGHRQTAVVGCLPVDSFLDGTVRRHESTLEEKEDARAAHIDALGAQTGPVFLAHRDDDAVDRAVARVQGTEPLYRFEADGVAQTVWRVPGGELADALERAFGDVGEAYVADGHHRAASAVRVALARRAAEAPLSADAPCNRVLVAMFPANQLRVLPYHRMVRGVGPAVRKGLAAAVKAAGFAVEPAAGPVAPAEKGVFGLFDGGRWWEMRAPADKGHDPVAALDAAALQERVLGPLLGIGDPRRDPRLSYVTGTVGPEAVEPAVRDAGELMPPKSTWFSPKPFCGLFVRRV
ncbi:DUF1015 domain-containing protein [Atopobiaceae bacterium 24-176]